MVDIVIRAEGRTWGGFTNLTVVESMDSPYTTLTLSTTDSTDSGVEVWNVRDGSFIEAFVDNIKVFEGDVNRYDVAIDANTHTIGISAASRAKDLTECSHVGQLNFKAGVRTSNAEAIVNLVALPFNIGVTIVRKLTGLELGEKDLSYNIRTGTTAFDAIRRIAEKDGLTVYTNSDFKLALDDGSAGATHAALTTGDYIALSTNHDIGRGYSEVIVKSQWKHKFDAVEERSVVQNYDPTVLLQQVVVTQPKKKAYTETQRTQVGFKNTAQTRYRPLMFVNNEKPAADETYAKYIAQRFAGQSVSATITVKSMLDKDDTPWRLANLLPISEPLADLNDVLIISGKTITITPTDGLTVQLQVTSPEAYRQDLTPTATRRRSIRRTDSVFSDVAKGLLGS